MSGGDGGGGDGGGGGGGSDVDGGGEDVGGGMPHAGSKYEPTAVAPPGSVVSSSGSTAEWELDLLCQLNRTVPQIWSA